jgi:hypothetical protein
MGREFAEWVEFILGTADVHLSRFHPTFLPYSYKEYKLLQELSPLSSAALVASVFGTLLAPPPQILQLDIGSPHTNACEKVPAQVHLPCPIHV